MKRQTLLFVLLITGTTVFCQSANPYPPTPTPDRIIMTWKSDPSSSQAVTWRTDTTVHKALAQIAPASPSPDFTLHASNWPAATELLELGAATAHYHSVNFSDLLPNTQYAYRVGDEKNWSEWSHFTTASDTTKPFSFIYFGDAQNDIKSLWSRTVRSAYSGLPRAGFMLHAGDLINSANADKEWAEWYYAGGWIFNTMNHLPVPGNHEYWRDDRDSNRLSKLWQPTFTLPENGPGNPKENAYYIDYQGVRFIALDTRKMLIGPKEMTEQTTWLEEVLKNNPQKWTIVCQHHPVYSTASGRDNKEMRAALIPIFEKHQVDLVLQGHDHSYGRGHNIPTGVANAQPKGPVYVVSVSGPKMYDLSFSEWLERAASNTQLYQYVYVDGDKLRFEAYTTTGELYDAFELAKKTDGSNAFFDLAPPTAEKLDLPRSDREKFSEKEWIDYRARFDAYKKKKITNDGDKKSKQ